MKIELRNLGTVNKNRVSIIKNNGQRVDLYFSYETIIAVIGSEGIKVSQNEWSKTTGKLLNELMPDKHRRIPHSEVLAYAQRELNGVSI